MPRSHTLTGARCFSTQLLTQRATPYGTLDAANNKNLSSSFGDENKKPVIVFGIFTVMLLVSKYLYWFSMKKSNAKKTKS